MAGIKGVRSFVAVVLHCIKVCSYVKTKMSLKPGDFMACIFKRGVAIGKQMSRMYRSRGVTGGWT
jgi:hypothetical protein